MDFKAACLQERDQYRGKREQYQTYSEAMMNARDWLEKNQVCEA